MSEPPEPQAAAAAAPKSAPGPGAASVEPLLAELRNSLVGWTDTGTPQLVECIRQLGPNAEQLLEIEALQHCYEAIGPQQAQAVLGYAAALLDAAQRLGAIKAEAAAWRLLQTLQSKLMLHQAALHSAGMAAARYQASGEPALAQAMSLSRDRVMLQLGLFNEVRATCLAAIADPKGLPAPFLHRALNGLASACFCLANESPDEEARMALWRESLQRHAESLHLAEALQQPLLAGMSRINLTVVHAMLGQVTEARRQLAELAQITDTAKDRPHWQAWCSYGAALVDVQDDSLPREQTWPAMLQLALALDRPEVGDSGVLAACLDAIVRLGPRLGRAADALRASQQLLRLQRQRKRALAHALGDTISAVMAQPLLLQKQQQLTAQGSMLEQALVQRNAELQQALARLQIEATVRQQAELALQRAHAGLELQVQQRSSELQMARRALLLQEQQLALSALVAASATEMSGPLAEARDAAAQMLDHGDALKQALDGTLRHRRELQARLDSLDQSGASTDAALERLAQMVQRFKALDTQG